MERLTSRHLKAAGKLIALLLEDKYLLRALIENDRFHSEGHIGVSIATIFSSAGQDVGLLKLTMPKAVELTPEPELLFRQDSILTDIAGRFMKLHGARFLKKALKPIIIHIIHRVKAGEDFAIENGRSTTSSVERLLQATNEVMLQIVAKASVIPSEIRTALAALVDATEAKFGSAKRGLAFVGLFWLRFVCPAIVDPVQAGVVSKSTASMNIELQRALLALSKTVKACADGQIPDHIALTAALQLKELSAQWRPCIDACFLELRQPAPRTSPEKGDAKSALTMACSLLQVLQRRHSDMTAVLNGYGAATTVRALDRILEVAQGDKKGGALSATAKGDAPLEAWTHEQVLGWLDCIGLAQHRPVFARRAMTGKTLLSLDPPALVLMGIEQEEEQWVILQSIRDNATLHQRYKIACANAVRRGARAFPPLDGLPTADYASLTVTDDSFDDNSSSSGTNTSPSASQRSNPPLSVSSSPKRASGSNAAPLDGSPRVAPEELPASCLFKVSLGAGGVRLIRAKRTDSLRALQISIEKELSVARCDQSLAFVDSAQRTVKIDTDVGYQDFLLTQATVTTNDLGSTAVYRLQLT